MQPPVRALVLRVFRTHFSKFERAVAKGDKWQMKAPRDMTTRI